MSIDIRFFPHLFELILDHVYEEEDEDTLRALRLTGPAVCESVDRMISSHMVVSKERVETYLCRIWKEEWSDGNPRTKLLDVGRWVPRGKQYREVTANIPGRRAKQFMRGTTPEIARVVPIYGNGPYVFGEKPGDVLCITALDLTKVKPLPSQRCPTFYMTNLHLAIKRHIVSFTYREGFELRNDFLVNWIPDESADASHDDPKEELDVTILLAPTPYADDDADVPAVSEEGQSFHLDRLVTSVAGIIGYNPKNRVCLVGSEFWEEGWWSSNGTESLATPSAYGSSGRAAEMKATWEQALDQELLEEFEPILSTTGLEEARRRVTFMTLDAFEEKVGDYVFDLCF